MSKTRYGMPLSRLSCFAITEEGGKAWFARLQANGLYEYDKIKNRVKLLTRFPDFPIDKDFLYSAIEKVGSILVLAPASASEVVLYDLASGKAEYLTLMPAEDRRKVKYTGRTKFVKSYRHGDSIYLFGFEYPAVLKINVNTKQLTYLTDWVELVEQRVKKIFIGMGYVSDYAVAGGYVWALCECANVVLRLDLRTDEIKVVDIHSDLCICCGICFDGSFWVAGYSESTNKLLQYDFSFMLKNEIEICSIQKNDDDCFPFLQDEQWKFYPIIDLGERLLLFSYCPRHVYEFDKILQKIRIHPIFEKIIKVQDEKLHDMGILTPRKKENLVCFIAGNDFLWNEYDFVYNDLTQYEVKAEDDTELIQKKSKFMNRKIFREDEMMWNLGYKMTLPRFLEHIVCMSESDHMKNKILE